MLSRSGLVFQRFIRSENYTVFLILFICICIFWHEMSLNGITWSMKIDMDNSNCLGLRRVVVVMITTSNQLTVPRPKLVGLATLLLL